MRIESYMQMQQVYKTTKKAKPEASGNGSFMDNVQISSFGKDIQAAKKAVEGSADVREDRVSEIKSAIENGTYEVDTDSFADKLFEHYNQMR